MWVSGSRTFCCYAARNVKPSLAVRSTTLSMCALPRGFSALPAGRNIHALDPYRMPSAAALERGSEAARLIVESHRRQNGGAFPETVAVNLWGLDAIKTKGESVAIVLHLVGARPIREGAG